MLLTSIRNVIKWLVVSLLMWMIIISSAQLILRFVFSSGIIYLDVQLRYLVLYMALLGGTLAASEKRHICINILEQYASKKIINQAVRWVYFGAAIGTFYLWFISIKFILQEKEMGPEINNILFGQSMPIWIIELVIPFSLMIMGFYFILTALDITSGSSKQNANVR